MPATASKTSNGRRFFLRAVGWGLGLLMAGHVVESRPAHASFSEEAGQVAKGAQGASAEESTEAGSGGSGAQGESRLASLDKAPEVCKRGKPLQVLFIGNSYTHYFDMPSLFEGIAASAGCAVEAEMIAPGGSRLALHAKNDETLAAIGSRAWDAVILQNFSQLPSQPPETVRKKTFGAVGTLVGAIKENNPSTAIYFYATWGRRDGDKKYCGKDPMVCTFEGHSAALQRGYQMYAEAFGGRIVNVGEAWARAASDPQAPFARPALYDPDGSHPSLRGSYLAASVFFSTLFNVSPQGLAYPADLNEKDARFIQQIAGTIPLSGA